MSTSIHGGRILLPTDVTAGDGDDPVGVARVRDGVANGLLHFADEAGQVWVSLMGAVLPSAVHPGEYVDYLEPRAAGSGLEYAADVFFPVALFDIAELRVGLRSAAGGDSYKLRVRVAGATGNAAAAADFLVAPVRDLTQLLARTDTPATDADYLTATTSSTTAAWLTGASQGELAHATLLYPSVLDTHLAVWARTTDETHVPRLYGLAAALYVGATS